MTRRRHSRSRFTGSVLCPVCEEVYLLPSELPAHLNDSHDFEWEQRRKNPNDYATQAVKRILGHLPATDSSRHMASFGR